MDEEIPCVDVCLHIEDVRPEQTMHISGVLQRVCAGLALEGFHVSLEMRPSPVYIQQNTSVHEDEEEESGDV